MPSGDAAARGRADGRLSVAVVPLANFTLTPFSGLLDTLRLAADEGDRSRPRACAWTVLGADRRSVRSSCGVVVQPHEPLGDPRRFDHVVVAGGLLPPPGDPMLDEATRRFLLAAHRAGCGVIGICTGSLALAEAGLLRPGERCCVSWFHLPDLQERFPLLRPVADRLWERAGTPGRPVITCAGGLAAVDLAAALVAERLGEAVARKSLHILLADGPRPAAAAQPQPPNLLMARDQRVRRAVLLMEQSPSAPPRAEALARAVGVSRRQLERLFQRDLGAGPQQVGRDMRLFQAVWLMAQDGRRISDVAAQCGFADAAHFGRAFRDAFGRTPAAARREGAPALAAMLEGWWPHGGLPPPHASAPRPAAGDRRPYI